MTPTRIRVLMVEDQPMILKSQLRLLNRSQEIEVVSTALSGEAALEIVAKDPPDVMLLDLGLPQMSGMEVTRRVKKDHPKVEILVFTIFEEEEKVLEAIRAGASGYLLKGAPADKIVEAIREVHGGGTVIQPSLARQLLKHFQPAKAPPASNPPGPAPGAATPRPLSEREMEILQLISKGISNNEAAALLDLSKATIRTHLEHIYEKLDVTNRVEAVTEGIRKGLIDI